MKNFGKIMALFAAVFMFSSIILSCSSDSGSDNGDDSETTGNVLLDQKIEKYMSYLGEYEGVEDLGGNCFVKKLKLEEKSITIDGTEYPFNPKTDITELEVNDNDLRFYVNNVKYVIRPPYGEYDLRFVHYDSNEMAYMKRVTSSSGGSSGDGDAEVVELSGTYSITGSSYGIRFAADGAWTLTNGGRATGTYVLNGSTLSVTSNGSTAKFKLSVSGSTVTLDGSNDNYSTGILSVWGVKDSQALQNGTVTIVKSE